MEKITLCSGWLFSKAGSAEKVTVNLPHDAMIFEKRSPKAKSKGACAWFEGGIYCYEKELFVPLHWQDQVLTLEFEGVYHRAKVYVNGNPAGGCAYGYSNFTVRIDHLVRFNATNRVLVVADNSQTPNSRWYSGAGIYRPVHLYVQNKHHILLDGVKVTTRITSPCEIHVKTSHTGGDVAVEILYGGEVKAAASGDDVVITVPEGKLWSAESPNLYEYRVTLTCDGLVQDVAEGRFGIRKIAWSNRGLLINGQETLLRGGCVHHDNGILGAADYPEASMRKIRILKEYGFNAIRSAHNPISKSMLDACDELGMYVMDEAFDMWFLHKNRYDYASDFESCHEMDVKAMIDKDFNHPSVIMYSIGNENNEPAFPQGIEQAKELVALCHRLDTTRPVTAGGNLGLIALAAEGLGIYDGANREEEPEKEESAAGSAFYNMLAAFLGDVMSTAIKLPKVGQVGSPFMNTLDISGYNYGESRYEMDMKKFPDRVICGSETMPIDLPRNWEYVKKYPQVIGDFMWTAWDYLGETGIGGWSTEKLPQEKPYPWLIADTGALDLIGNPTGEAALAKTVWGCSGEPMIYVRPIDPEGRKFHTARWRGTNSIPSWGWSGCEGQKATVEVFSDAYQICLKQNGKKVACKKVKACCATFVVPYNPGVLEAIAINKQGEMIGRLKLESPTGEVRAKLRAEKDSVRPGEVIFVDLRLVGENGAVESGKDGHFTVTVENGTLLAFGSAVQATEDQYFSGTFSTRYGCAIAVIKAGDVDGELKVTAKDTHGRVSDVSLLIKQK